MSLSFKFSNPSATLKATKTFIGEAKVTKAINETVSNSAEFFKHTYGFYTKKVCDFLASTAITPITGVLSLDVFNDIIMAASLLTALKKRITDITNAFSGETSAKKLEQFKIAKKSISCAFKQIDDTEVNIWFFQ